MKSKKVLLYFLPALIVTCMIFALSSRNSTASNQQSAKVTRSILDLFHNEASAELDTIDIDTEEGFNAFFSDESVGQFNLYIRMLAHMCEFGGLGLMILLGSKLCQFTQTYAFKLTLIWGLLVAILDECLQYFIPGRTASLLDVCKDMIGILGAIVCVLLGSYLLQHLKNKKTTIS